jgi:hypothetical protein
VMRYAFELINKYSSSEGTSAQPGSQENKP